MDLYTATSYNVAEVLTKSYSTSFSMSSRLFSDSIRKHIYAIYGMVRIADEIVDTYRDDGRQEMLDDFESSVYIACQKRYSTNPVLQAFADTAINYDIDNELIEPFFESMRVDLHRKTYNQAEYEKYIYGSAEVVGLMCLKVFVGGDTEEYDDLKQGARSLGAAFQKVNFLRDMAADYNDLGRFYFPDKSYELFSENDKNTIINDIENDFSIAADCIDHLPKNSRSAVRASYMYYSELLRKIKDASIDELKSKRIRVSNTKKVILLTKSAILS